MKTLDWPELNEMDRDALLGLIAKIRESLSYCENGTEFCLGLGKQLKVDLNGSPMLHRTTGEDIEPVFAFIDTENERQCERLGVSDYTRAIVVYDQKALDVGEEADYGAISLLMYPLMDLLFESCEFIYELNPGHRPDTTDEAAREALEAAGIKEAPGLLDRIDELPF